MTVPPFLRLPPLPRADAIVDPRVGDAGPALLALEDGAVFPGIAFGAPVAAGGDLVVNTSQTGYQEIATDPSYAGQVVVMTYPLIGNYGRLVGDDQSERPWLRGLVVANATAAVLDDARQLATLLRSNGIPAIAGVDTRALARHLRSTGCLRGFITQPGFTDREEAVALRARRAALGGPGLRGTGVARGRARGGRRPAPRSSRSWTSASRPTSSARSRRRGVRVRVLPHTASPEEVLAADVAGVVLSPGPGDPARLDGPVALARRDHRGRPPAPRASAWATRSSARAAGAETRRLRFGHHGANHPVQDLDTGYVQVTAQNHEVQVVAEIAAGERPASGSASSTSTTARSRACGTRRSPSRPSSTTPRAPPGRSTRSPCSTGSWTPAGAAVTFEPPLTDARGRRCARTGRSRRRS